MTALDIPSPRFSVSESCWLRKRPVDAMSENSSDSERGFVNTIVLDTKSVKVSESERDLMLL